MMEDVQSAAEFGGQLRYVIFPTKIIADVETKKFK